MGRGQVDVEVDEGDEKRKAGEEVVIDAPGGAGGGCCDNDAAQPPWRFRWINFVRGCYPVRQ